MALALFKEGMDCDEVASYLSLSTGNELTGREVMDLIGAKRGHHGKRWHDEARKLRAIGHTYMEIAEIISNKSGRYCCVMTARNWVVKA